MDVKRPVKWMSGAILSMLFVVMFSFMSIQAKSNNNNPMILAGPIGKSSSASARITLVIPPRPDKARKPTTQQTSEKPVDKPKQK